MLLVTYGLYKAVPELSLSLSLINVILVHTRLFEESAIGNLKMFLLMLF